MKIEIKEKIVIFGFGDFARIVCAYLSRSEKYQVVAFSVHNEFISESSLMGFPVVPFEEINNLQQQNLELNQQLIDLQLPK